MATPTPTACGSITSSWDRARAKDISRFADTLPLLTGSHVLENCGHWVQQEKSDEVNRLLMEFLAEVRPV